MAETCIVCLGDLNSGDTVPVLATSPGQLASSSDAHVHTVDSGEAHLPPTTRSRKAPSVAIKHELVARILPCGHNLHDDCLRPWVERANSCPICRASFNMVELHDYIGGPIISSYPVQDKEQVAEIDPAMIIEDDLFDAPIEPCMICHSYGEDSQLLLCDGCDNSCHTHCADLDGVPSGMFFCYECREDPNVVSSHLNNTTRNRTSTRRQPARGRGTRGGPRTMAWERVWMSVRDQLDFDLDFPFDDEDVLEQQRIEAQLEQERRDINFFQRRFRVAERQGAASRFRTAAATIMREQPARAPQQPESQDELRAWNAFEKARAIQQGTASETGRGRKRKSTTASPASPREEQPDRPLKRPRTRRQELVESHEPVAESSRRASLARRQHREGNHIETSGTNFLQSLLKEVETSPPATSPGISDQNDNPGFGLERSLSPDISPEASNANTPRAHTPPPNQAAPSHISPRPSSPTPLTINIMPIFPAAPEYSPKPAHSNSDDEPNGRARSRHRKSLKPGTKQSSPTKPHAHSPINLPSSPPSSRQTSPTRPPLSYSTKSEIQRMVSASLKPKYLAKEINKDQYTDINRDVSRLLYEKVGTEYGLTKKETREELQKLAEAEVNAAVTAIRGANPVKEEDKTNGDDEKSDDSDEIMVLPVEVKIERDAMPEPSLEKQPSQTAAIA